jgi:hypothetical protein
VPGDGLVGDRPDDRLGKGADEATRARYTAELRRVAAELAGPDPSPTERMLAETATLDWFTLRRHQAYHAAASCRGKGLTLVQSDFQQRKIERSHRRLMASLRTLAAVRKLAVAVLQVNIAKRQVNVAGAAPGLALGGDRPALP